ncbi:DNA topoisomerase I [Candidatus Woesearchaeota archaeon]|nr:DNA topoisomerase I [Candidatus Woesearchaeota archaeon]
MSYELIICEKPQAAKRIAESLADGKPIKETIKKISYYKITHGKNDIVVACAVGHLYGLAEKKKAGWTYPVFDIEWKPTADITKSAKFSKPYLDLLKKLAKDAKEFTVACDFDVEGEVIGWNVVRFACKKKDAKRMKFSTLTKDELIDAYENKLKHLEWGQAYAGETRHMLDWFWGINLSRALTLAVQKAKGGFRLLSSGRVQGPALKLVVDKEKEIRAFKPEPYWQLQMFCRKGKDELEAFHEKGNFTDEKEVSAIFEKIKNLKEAIVKKLETSRYNHNPPVPFDLTTLQTEAYRRLRFSPKSTLSLAQNLYIGGYISYPRTSSQKLPAKLGLKNILTKLKDQKEYAVLVDELLKKKNLKPNEGEKTDDAHPAIFPTGVAPKKLTNDEARLYDLIVKRFLSVFGDPAVRETMKVFFDVKDEIFVAEGKRTVEPNWHKFYEPYLKLKESEFPELKEGQKLAVENINKLDKETLPPKRYTESSIIKDMERSNIGTKSTRAQIVDTLFQRGYVTGKQVTATELGIKTVEVLEKHAPQIVDVNLTRHFEEEMEEIRHDKKESKEVISEAKDMLKIILEQFKKHAKDIGEGLGEAESESYRLANTIGKCPNCKEGMLMIRKSRFGKFVGCSSYPDCKTTFSLPKVGTVRPVQQICTECSYPMVEVQPPRARKQIVCINPKCVTWTSEYKKEKQEEAEAKKLMKAEGKEEKKKGKAKKPAKKAVKKPAKKSSKKK